MSQMPEHLMKYLAKRDVQHSREVSEFLASLTDRERALLKDAAVMGYVQGRRHPEGEQHPKDSWVLAAVIDACFAFPDLYPAMNTKEQNE